MTRSILVAGLMALSSVGLLGGCVCGEKAANSEPTNLVGTWLGESTSVTSKFGYEKGPKTLVIKDQKGTEFTGEKVWSFKSDKPVAAEGIKSAYDAATGTVTGAKNVLGTVDPATGQIILVEVDGDGEMSGRLVDDNTLVLVYSNGGAWARVVRVTLKRQGEAARK
jgi:hypothetical protein